MQLTCVTATYNVIAAGNRERLIRCVESVAKIPVEHEHLIYDGASTDGTVELLRELEKTTPGLKVVSEPDTGIYNALNKGVRDAKGEWFYVLGCDDYISNPLRMEEAIQAGEGVDFVQAPVVGDGVGSEGCEWNRRLWLCGAASPHQGSLIRTCVIRSHQGFDESFRLVADSDLMQRLVFAGVRTSIYPMPYCTFQLTGASSNEALVAPEFQRMCERRFGLTPAEARLAYPKRILPLRVVLPFLFSRRLIFRLAARYQLGRWIANHLGLIDSAGHFRFKRK